MKMDYKKFIGMLGIVLAFGLVFVACDSGGGGGGGDDTTVKVSQVEDAFTKMLKSSVQGKSGNNNSDITVNAIKKMSSWEQTDSAYSITGTKGEINYDFPYEFPCWTGKVRTSGGAVVTTTLDAYFRLDASSSSPNNGTFSSSVGEGQKTKNYSFMVAVPSITSGGDYSVIRGTLNLILSAWN